MLLILLFPLAVLAVTLPSLVSSSASSSTLSTASACTAAAPTMTTAPYGSVVKPKILILANDFELAYWNEYNFTTQYTGPLIDFTFACTDDKEICYFDCGTNERCLQQITALIFVPGIDLSQTYTFITGTGGCNPNYGTAGGAAIAQYSIFWEHNNMFLGSDLPANFSGNYFFSYGEDVPWNYPVVSPNSVYELNGALIDRFYNLSQNIAFTEVEPYLQELRSTYVQPAAQRAPFLSKCDNVAQSLYWHGEVAGHNVEYFTNVVTSGAAKPCNSNEDDMGRLLGLSGAASIGRYDFNRTIIVKAFSNFDRPPPQLDAYQSRFFVGEAATEPGLVNAFKVITAAINDILNNWDCTFKDGIAPTNYVGDAIGSLGGTPPFAKEASAVAGSIQGS